MNKREIKVKSNLLYKGKILNLYVDEVLCPNGKISNREKVEHCPGVAILLINEYGVLLEKQYRYVYDEELLEIPAGKVEQYETLSQAATRELQEETGFICKDMKMLGCIYPSSGYTNEKIYLFLAKTNECGNPSPDDDEFIEWDFYSLKDVRKMITNGQIKDAKTISALYFYSQYQE